MHMLWVSSWIGTCVLEGLQRDFHNDMPTSYSDRAGVWCIVTKQPRHGVCIGAV